MNTAPAMTKSFSSRASSLNAKTLNIRKHAIMVICYQHWNFSNEQNTNKNKIFVKFLVVKRCYITSVCPESLKLFTIL